MTELTDNEVIAWFDGWNRNPDINKGSRIQWTHPKYSTKLSDTLSIPTTPENMKYSTSWEWLMDVWYKFKDLKVSGVDNEFTFVQHSLKIKHAILELGPSPSEACKLLAEGIRWYNSVKK